MDTLGQVITIAVGLIAVLGGVWGVWRKWLRPAIAETRELAAAARVTLIGHAEVRDPGRPDHVLEPARPGALDRLGSLEEAVRDLGVNDQRITSIESMVVEHGRRIDRLEERGQIERSLSHIAQAKAFDAIGEVAKSRDDADSTG